MLERCRLFLIIALGEAVLTTATAISRADSGASRVLTGTFALIAIVALWGLYFGVSDELVSRYVETTSDPIRAARLAINVLVVALTGTIALAVGNELVIFHPRGDAPLALTLLLFGGPVLYVLAQMFYVTEVNGELSRSRLIGIAAFVVAGSVSRLVTPDLALALLAAVLLLLMALVSRESTRDAASAL